MRTSLQRPWQSRASFSGAPSDPTGHSGRKLNCPPIWAAEKGRRRPPASRKPQRPKKSASRPIDKVAERKAALAFEKEQKRRERERASEEAARQKERERRQQAVDKAQAALQKAEREHAKKSRDHPMPSWRFSEKFAGRRCPLGGGQRAIGSRAAARAGLGLRGSLQDVYQSIIRAGIRGTYHLSS